MPEPRRVKEGATKQKDTSDDRKESQQTAEEDDSWERFSPDTKVDLGEKEDIDPSRYVIVVENEKKSEGLGARRNLEKKKRQRRREGTKKKGKKNFICDICREELTNEEELDRHRRTRHINDKSEFFCDFCLKIFKTKAILKGHRYKHISDPQFLCVRCGKKYFTISNLNEHSLYCLDEKKFECPVCFKKFNVNKQFKRHLVIHEADRYIKCTVCEQTFSRKDNYRQHFRRHTGEKPYTCDVCGKSFRIKATYNYHRRTHRDVRPSDSEGCKAEAHSETEFGVHHRKESGDGFFQGVDSDFALRHQRDETDFAFRRSEIRVFPDEVKAEKEPKRGEFNQRIEVDYPSTSFPDNFLRKSFQQRRQMEMLRGGYRGPDFSQGFATRCPSSTDFVPQ